MPYFRCDRHLAWPVSHPSAESSAFPASHPPLAPRRGHHDVQERSVHARRRRRLLPSAEIGEGGARYCPKSVRGLHPDGWRARRGIPTDTPGYFEVLSFQDAALEGKRGRGRTRCPPCTYRCSHASLGVQGLDTSPDDAANRRMLAQGRGGAPAVRIAMPGCRCSCHMVALGRA